MGWGLPHPVKNYENILNISLQAGSQSCVSIFPGDFVYIVIDHLITLGIDRIWDGHTKASFGKEMDTW